MGGLPVVVSALFPNGKLELTSKYFEFSNFGNKNHFYTEELKDLFGIKKVFYQKKPSIKQIKIAKALQICAEEIGFHFLDHLYYLTKQKNLVVFGVTIRQRSTQILNMR